MTCLSVGGGAGSDVSSASRATVAAIVAVWNAGPVLGDCLDAIAAQSRAVSAIFVIDDASTDGSAALVRHRRDPRIKLIELPQNVGPAEARNRALPSVTADYVWIVDADCIPRPDCLAKLCGALERDPRIGIVGGANPYDRQHATYASAAFDWSNRYLADPTAPASEEPYVVGANMLLRRVVFDRVGAYDPSLRIAEDFDLCVRARATDWQVWFEPRAISDHRHHRMTIASYLRYEYKIGFYGCRFRLKHRGAVPYGRFYPTTPVRAVLLAPFYVGMALARILTRTLKRGSIGPVLWHLPLITLGQCWAVTGVIRGVAHLQEP